jgi:protein-tyrosine-phosphatase/predicted ATP-grasp superfamily ATP-dependent carboligase
MTLVLRLQSYGPSECDDINSRFPPSMSPADNKRWRALVLDVESSAGLEVVQSLGRRRVVMDVASRLDDCLAFHSRYVHRKLAQPAYDCSNAEFSNWIHSLNCLTPYDLIVPSTEASLLSMKTLESGDEVRLKAVLPRNQALEIALDKVRTWELASKLGIPVPQSVVYNSVDDLGEEPAYPVVLKPVSSKVEVAGQLRQFQPTIVRNQQERAAVLESWLQHVHVQQQRYITGCGIGIELLFNKGQKVWHFAHERLHEYPLTGGRSTYRKSILPHPGMLAAAETMLRTLEWHGVAMVEFKLGQNGEFHLLEINPRLWGSLALAIDAGVDFPFGLLLLASHQDLPPQPHYRIPYYTRDFALDLAWQTRNLRADHRSPLLLTRSRPLALLEYLRVLVGHESWDHFDLRDLRITYLLVRSVCREFSGIVRQSAQKHLLKAKLGYRHRRLLRRNIRPKNLLFICYGNICRSPIAEHLARTKLSGVQVSSAGLYDVEGRPCPQRIVRIGAKMGLDLSGFRSRKVSQRQIDQADLILIMDLENYAEITKRYPSARNHTTSLGLFANVPSLSIPDPYYSSEEETEKVSKKIQSAIAGLNEWLGTRR